MSPAPLTRNSLPGNLSAGLEPEGFPMDDATLLQRINELVAEEEKLLETPKHDAARVHELEVMLDQCFDLLRQRRAKREFGLDPDSATPRDPNTVENYQQ
jgi:hypothetical protein